MIDYLREMGPGILGVAAGVGCIYLFFQFTAAAFGDAVICEVKEREAKARRKSKRVINTLLPIWYLSITGCQTPPPQPSRSPSPMPATSVALLDWQTPGRHYTNYLCPPK